MPSSGNNSTPSSGPSAKRHFLENGYTDSVYILIILRGSGPVEDARESMWNISILIFITVALAKKQDYKIIALQLHRS
jgi:hypothetical protein